MSKGYNPQELYNKYSKNKKNSSQNSFNKFFMFSLFYPFGAIAVFAYVFVSILRRDIDKASMIIHNGAFICIITCLVMAMSLSPFPITISKNLLKKRAKNTRHISSDSPSVALYMAYMFQAIIMILLIVGTAVVIYCFMIFFDFPDNFLYYFVEDFLNNSFGKLFDKLKQNIYKTGIGVTYQ